jgi:hypothetical protein
MQRQSESGQISPVGPRADTQLLPRMRVIGRNPMSVIVRVFGLKADMVRLPRRATCGLMHRNKRTHAPQQADSCTAASGISNAAEPPDHDLPARGKSHPMLVENKRYTVWLAEAAIGEVDSVSLYELRRRGLVGMSHYGHALITQSARPRVRALELLSRNRRHSAPWAPRSARSPRQLLRSP